MTVFQIDRAISHDGMDALKIITDNGSIAFLQGIISVYNAMKKLDEGDFAAAHHDGLDIAPPFFLESYKQFQEASFLIKNDVHLKQALGEYLHNVDYDRKAGELNIESDIVNHWYSVQNMALHKGADSLFEEAAMRAKTNEELSQSFFLSVRADGYPEIGSARLLAKISVDILVGAFVSAIFAPSQR